MYGNNVSFNNPYSGSLILVDYDSDLGTKPALFMTANTTYAYTGTSKNTKLAGSVIVYFDLDGSTSGNDHTSKANEYVKQIEFYYFDKDGTKSDLFLTYGAD